MARIWWLLMDMSGSQDHRHPIVRCEGRPMTKHRPSQHQILFGEGKLYDVSLMEDEAMLVICEYRHFEIMALQKQKRDSRDDPFFTAP